MVDKARGYELQRVETKQNAATQRVDAAHDRGVREAAADQARGLRKYLALEEQAVVIVAQMPSSPSARCTNPPSE